MKPIVSIPAVLLPLLLMALSACASAPSASGQADDAGRQTAQAPAQALDASQDSNTDTNALLSEKDDDMLKHEVSDHIRSSDAHPSRGGAHERKAARQ